LRNLTCRNERACVTRLRFRSKIGTKPKLPEQNLGSIVHDPPEQQYRDLLHPSNASDLVILVEGTEFERGHRLIIEAAAWQPAHMPEICPVRSYRPDGGLMRRYLACGRDRAGNRFIGCEAMRP
jgi:hypothetical protein